ncbi:unnamed protein product [Ectocarpus sp. 12 AP-2014]
MIGVTKLLGRVCICSKPHNTQGPRGSLWSEIPNPQINNSPMYWVQYLVPRFSFPAIPSSPPRAFNIEFERACGPLVDHHLIRPISCMCMRSMGRVYQRLVICSFLLQFVQTARRTREEYVLKAWGRHT